MQEWLCESFFIIFYWNSQLQYVETISPICMKPEANFARSRDDGIRTSFLPFYLNKSKWERKRKKKTSLQYYKSFILSLAQNSSVQVCFFEVRSNVGIHMHDRHTHEHTCKTRININISVHCQNEWKLRSQSCDDVFVLCRHLKSDTYFLFCCWTRRKSHLPIFVLQLQTFSHRFSFHMFCVFASHTHSYIWSFHCNLHQNKNEWK